MTKSKGKGKDYLVAGSPAYIKRQWINHHNSLQGTCGVIKSHLKRIAECPSASPGVRQKAERLMVEVGDMAELLRAFRIEPDGSKSVVDIRPKKKDPRSDRNIQNSRTY